jgi:DNA-binding XRE family transcriptional regulator
MKREKLIQARKKRGLSQDVAAGLVGVSRNTWSDWEQGKSDPYPLNVGELCRIFDAKDPTELDLGPALYSRGDHPMSEASRREILKQVALALGLAVVEPLYTQSPALNDLDLVDNYIEALQRLLVKGEAQYVMQASQHLYTKLLQKSQERDMRLAETQIRLGMLVGLSREYVLPWYQRAQAVMEIYNQIEAEIINDSLRHHYARLQAKRSRQHRVLWQFDACEKECEDGISSLQSIEDYPLRTHFLCERAHLEATQGDESLWIQRLEEARVGVLNMPLADREKAFNQIDYMQGEGYKRFAFHVRKELPISMREAYAQYAYDQFTRWDGATIELPGFESLVVQVSRTQCLILLDPKSAIESARQLGKSVQQSYPALLDKVHRVMLLAQKRLQMKSDDFLQVFDEPIYQTGSNIL